MLASPNNEAIVELSEVLSKSFWLFLNKLYIGFAFY
jgi:hypothetical protein